MPRAAPKRVYKIAKEIKEGFEISDHHSNTWIVGEAIAQGGFGSLYVGMVAQLISFLCNL